MAKFYGSVGFVTEQKETSPGVYEDVIEERVYTGDITRNYRRNASADKVNDDLAMNNEISILADPFAYSHYSCIRYVLYLGARWSVSSVQVAYPRLVIEIGGVYNGQTGPTAETS